MTTTTMEVYKALISAGISEDLAEAAAQAVLSRQEATNLLVTKAEFYKGLMLQATFIVTVMTAVQVLV